MADSTTNYSWDKPNVGGDTNNWGVVANLVFDAIDTALKTVADLAAAALSRAGGTLTGRLNLLTATVARVNKGAISGATAFDLATGQYFTLTIAGDITPSFTNTPAGAFATGVVFRVTNGGAHVINWPAAVKWTAGAAPTLTAAGIDLICFMTDDDGATFRGVVVALDVR